VWDVNGESGSVLLTCRFVPVGLLSVVLCVLVGVVCVSVFIFTFLCV
jgi:hypothetical protein